MPSLSSRITKSARGLQLALLALIGTLAIAGQLSQVSQQAPAAPQDGKVRVYVYRNSGVLAKEFRPSVFADETDVAQVQAGRNLILALRPGKHVFRSTDKKDEVALDLKPGQKYYLRIDVSLAALKGRGKAVAVPAEQAGAEFGQTTPADDSMLKDRTLIAPEFKTN
jgi:hypothetical protein